MKKLAIVFPGQGSQSVGMLAELAQQYVVVKQTFEEASDVLNIDLWKLSQEGPAEQLNQTEFTQPALLAAGIAVWRVWQQENGVIPNFLAGHSLGEYTALVAAESISFSDGIALVNKRGLYMQTAVPEGTGAMAALLGLTDEQAITVCKEAAENQILSAANFNSPGQVVIAGNAEAVERGIALAKLKGAKRALPLSVSVPSHCELMRPAAEKLALDLNAIHIKIPKISVVNNVDVAVYKTVEEIKQGLLRQLYSSVRWVEIVNYLQKQHTTMLIELGPGKVLTGLNKRICETINSLAVYDQASLELAKGDTHE